jgi:hypothetical protein
MAAHVRTQIRQRIATLLTGLPTTGSNVFSTRVYPLQDSELPALRIFTEREPSQTITMNPPGDQERILEVRVEAIAKTNTALDDTLDEICKEVEIALVADALEPLARSIDLRTTETNPEGSAEHPTGSAIMTFEVGYVTARNAPDVAL